MTWQVVFLIKVKSTSLDDKNKCHSFCWRSLIRLYGFVHYIYSCLPHHLLKHCMSVRNPCAPCWREGCGDESVQPGAKAKASSAFAVWLSVSAGEFSLSLWTSCDHQVVVLCDFEMSTVSH
jgi:hypothetical protein